MRIVMVSDSYYPYVSGVTRAVATLRNTLAGMGHEALVFCPAYPGAEPEEGVVRFPSILAPTNSTFYVALPSPLRFLREILRADPDAIHVHSPFNLSLTGLRTGRRLGIPVVMTYHTMYNMYAHYVPIFGRGVSEYVETIAFATARKADALVTPSPTMARYLREGGASHSPIPIPNGIPVSEFQGGDTCFLRDHYGVPEGPVVLTSGRLVLEKNLSTLLRAFAKVSAATSASLVLVGDGPRRKALEEEARSLGIADRTFFLGTVAPDKMPSVYAGGSIFMFTSLTDTQGLVLVEAKAAGLPSVAVGALGVKDMVEDGEDGYLCENNPDQVAERAIDLLSDPAKLAAMSCNARRNAQAFSREASAARLVAIYESLISRGKPRY